MDRLLTPAEVAARLRVSTTTLSIWRSTGRQRLPYVKRGRSVLYREADVSAFIAAMPEMLTSSQAQ